jgi:hypothetical protein
MALKMQIQTKYGIPAEYHKILETHINWCHKTASVRVGVFVDETARRDGNRPIEQREYPRPASGPYLFPFDADKPVLEAAYGYLKSLDEYKEAKDVLEGVKA